MKIIALTGAGISQNSGIPTLAEKNNLRDVLTREYANEHPHEYNETIKEMYKLCHQAKPNDAHFALAQYHIPVITMNIDGLHKKAGSDNVLEIHGTLPQKEDLDNASLLVEQPVLYGDIAPLYKEAITLVDTLGPKDILLIIGVSDYTSIQRELKELAYFNGVEIVEINYDSQHKVREFLKQILGGEGR